MARYMSWKETIVAGALVAGIFGVGEVNRISCERDSVRRAVLKENGYRENQLNRKAWALICDNYGLQLPDDQDEPDPDDLVRAYRGTAKR